HRAEEADDAGTERPGLIPEADPVSARSRGHTRSRPVLAVVVAVALAAPACGGGPADGDDEAVSTSTVPPSSISEDPPFFEAEPLPLLPTTTTPPVELGVDPPPPVP